MRTLALPLAMLLLVTAFAGCFGGDDTPPADDGTPEPDGNDPNGNPSDPDPSDPDPVGSLTNSAPAASLDASYAANEIPQDITFELNGSDPDGDSISWTLDVTGDGEPEAEGASLPMNYTHTFSEEGEFPILFTVSDGQATTEETLTIVLSAAADPNAEPPVIQDVSASWTVGPTACGAQYLVWPAGTPAGGITHAEFAIDADTYGQQFFAEISSSGALFVEIDFYDATFAVLPGGSFALEDETTITGTVPANAAWGIAFGCGAEGGDIHYYTTGSPP